MVATISGMAKTEQVRLDTELTRDARIVAAELFGESLPEFISRVVREVVEEKLPEAAKIINARAERPSRQSHPEAKPRGKKS